MITRRLFLLILAVVLGIFVIWQTLLNISLSSKSVSCGGDFSYDQQCPMGSRCDSLGQGQIAGGICRPWIDF